MADEGTTLNEREVASLLKRIDGMVPAEQAECRLMRSSKRLAYGRATAAVLWVAFFSCAWAFLYYTMLSEESGAMSYILPRLSLSVGLMAAVVYLRMTDRLNVWGAVAAGAGIYVISRAII